MTYDLYGHLAKQINDDILFDDGKVIAFMKHLIDNSHYIKTSQYEGTNKLGKTIKHYLGQDIDASTLWTISEIFHSEFSIRAESTEKKLGEEILKIKECIKKEKNEQTIKKKKAEQKKKKIQKNDLKKTASTKPVWDKLLQRTMLNVLITDTDDKRVRESTLLPPLAFRMKISVSLKSALVITGDRPLVAHENPFCTEKVTGMPILRASTLKGQARHATLSAISPQETAAIRVDEIFGFANESEDNGHIGRLSFFPTYLEKEITHDIIAPHKEETRRVDKPVCLEVVEPHDFTIWLQYWPLDLMNTWLIGGEDVKNRLMDDFIDILYGMYFWFQEGIGAKTNSGYGRVNMSNVNIQLFASAGSPWAGLIDDTEAVLAKLLTTEKEILGKQWETLWNSFESSRQTKEAEAPHE